MFIIIYMNSILFAFYTLVIVTSSLIFVIFSVWYFGSLSWLVLWVWSTLCLLLALVCRLSWLLVLARGWVLLLLNAGDFLGFAISVVAPSLVLGLAVEVVASLAFSVSQNCHASGAHLGLGYLPLPSLGVRRWSSPLLTGDDHVLELLLSSGILFVIILGLGNCSPVRTSTIFILTSCRRRLCAWIIMSTCSHWPTTWLSLSTARCSTWNFTFRFVVVINILFLVFAFLASLCLDHVFNNIVLFMAFHAKSRFHIICHGVCFVTWFANPFLFLKWFLFFFFSFFVLEGLLLIL